MTEQLDVRGLSCPQPVFKTQEKLVDMKKGELVVLVDDETAHGNVVRTAERYKWTVETKNLGPGEYKLIITKK